MPKSGRYFRNVIGVVIKKVMVFGYVSFAHTAKNHDMNTTTVTGL
jgi:hypothetical protein